MKIVVIDGHALNPGDLDWSPLSKFGNYQVFPRADEDWLLQLKDAEIIITNKFRFSSERLTQLPKLKYIGVTATGVDIIDLAAAKQKGIVVSNVPAYSTPSVAQQTFALLLEITNQVGEHANSVRQGDWSKAKDFTYWTHSLIELSGLTLGIVGFGHIGQEIAKIAAAFGMHVLAYNRSDKSAQFPHIDFVDLNTLLQRSDVVSLSCPLTPETKHIINEDSLKQMKATAILLNTARGPLIDENALAKALTAKKLYAAGLDVLSIEPPANDNPLTKLENCYITPHIAWATFASRQRCLATVIKNIEAFLAGKPANVVT